MTGVNAAWGRACRRVLSIARETERRPGGLVAVGSADATSDDVALAFAGTDLPAHAVLDRLGHLAETQDIPREFVGELQGLALAAFLFGWESRS